MRLEPGDTINGRVIEYFDQVITAVTDGEPETKLLVTHHAEGEEAGGGVVPEQAQLRTEYEEFLEEYA